MSGKSVCTAPKENEGVPSHTCTFLPLLQRHGQYLYAFYYSCILKSTLWPLAAADRTWSCGHLPAMGAAVPLCGNASPPLWHMNERHSSPFVRRLHAAGGLFLEPSSRKPFSSTEREREYLGEADSTNSGVIYTPKICSRCSSSNKRAN